MALDDYQITPRAFQVEYVAIELQSLAGFWFAIYKLGKTHSRVTQASGLSPLLALIQLHVDVDRTHGTSYHHECETMFIPCEVPTSPESDVLRALIRYASTSTCRVRSRHRFCEQDRPVCSRPITIQAAISQSSHRFPILTLGDVEFESNAIH